MKKSTSQSSDAAIMWPSLIQGVLIKRYKRFMADVKLRNGHVVTAHCPNSGSMKTCSEPGRPVYLSRSANPNRRLKYTWEMIRMPTSLVGVNTSVPNRLVRESILAGKIKSLNNYQSLRTEVKYGRNSRIDILLEDPDRGHCYVEVKNCTLIEDKEAYFPDAVTSRGLKHLAELEEQVKQGHRGVIFFLIQRMDASSFRPADHIDPAYGAELRRVLKNNVEIIVYDVRLNLERIVINQPIAYEL
jgi:sugar fermentation stimulation protein A